MPVLAALFLWIARWVAVAGDEILLRWAAVCVLCLSLEILCRVSCYAYPSSESLHSDSLSEDSCAWFGVWALLCILCLILLVRAGMIVNCPDCWHVINARRRRLLLIVFGVSVWVVVMSWLICECAVARILECRMTYIRVSGSCRSGVWGGSPNLAWVSVA